jgi:N-acetylglutamate synthase-like GNAT family acetyltransferase
LADLLLRTAREADFPAIRQLIYQSRLNPSGLNWRRFVVAESPQGEFAGCGQIKPHPQGMLELASIAICAEYRNQGIAAQIIQRLLSDESARPIYLTCRAELGEFYERFGFRDLTPPEMPPYYRNLSYLANFVMMFSKNRMLVMALARPEQET